MRKLRKAAGGTCASSTRFSASAALLAGLLLSSAAHAANPVASNDSYSTTVGTALDVAAPGVLADDTDADSDPLTASTPVTGPAHGSVTLNPDGSFHYAPTPLFSGTDTFTYQANDGTSLSNIATVTITVSVVNVPPSAVNDSYSTNQDTQLTVNAANGVLKNDTDANNDTLTAALNANVAHGTLALNADGSFVYMPNAGYTGSDTFTYHANDGTANGNVATVTITVNAVNHAPVAVNDAFAVNQDTSANSFDVLANDTDSDAGDTKTITALGATNHSGAVSIVGGGANNTLSYTPAPGFVGTETFTYTMRDTAGLTATATVTVTVSNVNHAPAAVNDSFTVNQDTSANSFDVLANDTDSDAGDTKTITAVGATNHSGTVSIVGAGANNTLSYTPAPGFVGTETFTYTMRDTAGLTASATVTVTVSSVNHPPVAVNDAFTVNQDTSANSFNVLANDTDPDAGDTKTITATGATNHGGTVSIVGAGANNTLSYTPAAGYVGTETFTYTMRDTAGLTSTATVTVTVASVNHAPTAVNDPVTVNQDTSANSLNVLANDTDPDAGDTKTITTVGATDHGGTVSIVGAGANNTLSYTPAAGFVGTETFTYTMRDTAGLTSSATVTVTVSHVNHAPVATADSYSTNKGTALTVDAANGVLKNDTDPDTGDTLTAVLNANVAHGVLALNANGSFTYTPAAGYGGPDSFTYHASDGTLSSNTVTVSLTVNDRAPVANADSYTTNEDTPLVVPANGVLTNDTDPDAGDTLTAVLNTSVTHGTLTLNSNGSFTYTPAANYNGPDSFTYHANDGTLDSPAAAVTITIAPVNDPPTFTSTAPTTARDDATYVYAVTATDVDGDTLVILAPQLPAWLTLTTGANGSASLSGKPAQANVGVNHVTLSVSDPTGPPVLQNFDITVTHVNVPPKIQDPIPDQTATEAVPYSLSLAPFVTDPDKPASSLTYAVTSGLPASLLLSAAGAISGTPLGVDVGPHQVKFTVSDGIAPPVPGSFNLNVLRAGRTDLAITLTATPNPIALGGADTWTFAIKNNAPTVDVPGVTLTATFAGEVPFQFDPPSDPGCTFSISGSTTQLSCTLGAVAATMTRTLSLTGHGSFAGDVFANAKVAVAGPVPIDETPANDTTTTALSVAQRVSSGPAQTISGIDARGIAAGDFNGDGFVDLAVATGSGTGVLLNIVDPANASRRILSSTPIALAGTSPSRAIVVADLNADHNFDIVTAGGAGFPSRLYLNSGGAAFTAADVGDVNDDSYGVAVGDVNGDGLPDLVFANNGPTSVYFNRGSGIFELAAKLGTANSRGAVLVDLFGDTLPELVLANASGGATVYRNTAGAFSLELTLPTGPTTSVTAADFNGDQRADLVFGRDTSTLPATPSAEVWLNTSAASGSFFLSDQLGASLNSAVATADIDLNGSTDIIVVNETGAHQVYANSGTSSGAFNLFAQQLGMGAALAVATGKFSVDDRLDVALAGPGGIAIFYNDGAGNLGGGDLTPPTITLKGAASVTLTVGDTYTDAGATATDALDGDLTAKIVTTNPVNTAQVGDYSVTYNVKDTSGNAATPVTRTVTVKAVGGSTGGGGATGLEFVLGLILAMIAARQQKEARWRTRKP